MYGWVLDCFQLFAQERWGSNAWNLIKEQPLTLSSSDNDDELLLPTLGGFIRHKYYPDSLSVHLFVTSSRLYNEDFDQVLEAYGEFFIQYYERSNYSHMLKSVASSLQTFLNSVNRIHANLQIALPDLLPPDLLTFTLNNNENEKEKENEVEGKEASSSSPAAASCCSISTTTQQLYLLYRSKRQGLGPLTKGVVKASAREFVGFDVFVEEINKIPDCIDINCPSIFVDTYNKDRKDKKNIIKGDNDDGGDGGDGGSNNEDITTYGNIKLFRITAVNPKLSYLLLEQEEKGNKNIITKKRRCKEKEEEEEHHDDFYDKKKKNNNEINNNTQCCPLFTGMKLLNNNIIMEEQQQKDGNILSSPPTTTILEEEEEDEEDEDEDDDDNKDKKMMMDETTNKKKKNHGGGSSSIEEGQQQKHSSITTTSSSSSSLSSEFEINNKKNNNNKQLSLLSSNTTTSNKEECESKHNRNDNDDDNSRIIIEKSTTATTAAAEARKRHNTLDDDVENGTRFDEEEQEHSTTTPNNLSSNNNNDNNNNNNIGVLRQRRRGKKQTNNLLPPPTTPRRKNKRLSYRNSCISFNNVQNWLCQDDLEKIFHFYVIVSSAASADSSSSSDNDTLVIDDIGADILGIGATNNNPNNNHDFDILRTQMDELEEKSGSGQQRLKSKDLFDFISPPIQHTYTALEANANAPMIVSIRNDDDGGGGGSSTTISSCLLNNNEKQQIRRSYLLKPVVLSNQKRILLYGTPLVRTLKQVEQYGLELSDLSPETKDLVCLTEHFAAEVASSKKLDQANKALVDKKKQKLWIKLSKQMRNQRIARFIFLLLFFGLDVADVITNWLGYEEIVTNPNLISMVNPYFAFLIIISAIMVGVLGMSIKEMIQIAMELYRNEMKIESAVKDGIINTKGDDNTTSFESKVKRLKTLKGKIRSGIFDIVTALIDDASMTIFSVIGLKLSTGSGTAGATSDYYGDDDVTSSPLFVSMCISLLVLGFKIRSIESLLLNYRESSEVTREKEEMQLDSLKTITTNNNRKVKKTITSLTDEEQHQRLQQEEEKRDRIDVSQSILDIVDFIA